MTEISTAELAALSHAYGWTHATASLIHSGENATFLIEPQVRCVVRRYRSRDLSPIRAELAWMTELSKHVAVPLILPTQQNDLFTQIDGEVYAVFEYLEGHFIEENTANNLLRLGQLFNTLHTASQEIAQKMPKDWLGWQRPTFNREEVIDKPFTHLLAADFLTSEDKARCERVAAELSERFQPLEETFVHADLHFGNVLSQRGQWFCLDFDECGFGPRYFDLGVVKFHLLAEDGLGLLPDFLRGYGAPVSEQDLSFGTALRIFYTAGKIPKRLDIPDLARNPRAVIQRYLGYLESELNISMSPWSQS